MRPSEQIWFFVALGFPMINAEGSYTTKNLVRFPYSDVQDPFIGIFLALSLPLEIPDLNVFFSYNMEANYELPSNESEFTYPPLLTDQSERAWNRKFLYDILEFKLQSHNYPGRNCLLRTICEGTLYSTAHTGILGDILHIILTPSTSKNSNLSKDYEEAELYGTTNKNCTKYHKLCSVSMLSLISTIGNYLKIFKQLN